MTPQEFVADNVLLNLTRLLDRVGDHLPYDTVERSIYVPATEEEEEDALYVYEHWAVTPMFRSLLRNQSYTELDGIIIWNRTTTGQAIYLDTAIEEAFTTQP